RRATLTKVRLRRPPHPLVPGGAPSGGGGPAPLTRSRSLQARRARATAPRARRRAGRPRPPPVVPLHARALAAVPRRRPSPATRRCVTRTRAYAIVLAACVLPRAIVLLHERGGLLDNMEKSDLRARVLLKRGNFGYIPGEPSANPQPLYGWFLWIVYWLAGRHWWSIGIAQLLVAAATAIVVYEIGRRELSNRAGLIAAVVATLQ